MGKGYIDPYGWGSGGVVHSGAGSVYGQTGYIDPYGFSKGNFGSAGIAGGPATRGMRVHHGGGGLFGWVGSKLSLAGHDIAAMPAGFMQLGHAAAHDAARIANEGHFGSSYTHREGRGNYELPHLGHEMVRQTYQSLRHPLRDPFQALLSIGSIAAPVAGVAARASAAADAASAADEAGILGRAGEAAKAFAHKPLMPTRTLHVPTVVKDEAGDLHVVHQPVNLVESHAPLARAAQALHDRILQRSLDANLTAEHPSLVGRYAASRVGRATSEEARIGLNTRAVAAHALEHVKGFDKGVQRGHGQLALFLRSANVLPHEAAEFWRAQAEAGVNPEETSRLSRWAHEVHRQGLVHTGPDGRVAIDRQFFPKLSAVDDLVRANQAARERVINDHNLMSPEGVEARKALVAETMHSEAARNAETGVRQGQGYTPLGISEKRSPLSPFARSRSPIIPQAKPFSLSHEATGEGIRTGRIPDSTTKGVAHATQQALRYLGSEEHRGLVYRYGSDVRRSGHDVLIADPEAHRLGEIPLDTKQLLGREHSTLNTIPQNEEAGLTAAMKAKLEDAIPGRSSEQAKRFEEAAGIGTEAPAGYRWVPRQMLGELVHETTPTSRVGKLVNDLNSAVTAATVYFKLSHIPQRLATNATTSLLNGALLPDNLRFAIKLRKALSDQEFGELAASTGTHGYQALPAEGTSKAATLARKGAGFYAHKIDAPFRFLNLVHEARAAGIDDLQGFRDLIEAAKNPGKATARQLSVLKRANRVSMIYDGLGPNEKRFITRGVWFYPWVKASTRFAGHTIAEHPLASEFGGQAGAIGERRQAHELGALPYYEYGLLPLGGNMVSDPGNLSPFATAGQMLQIPAHMNEARGNLNPVAAALVDLLTGTDSFGSPSHNRGATALGDLLAPTPEAQALAGFRRRHKDQSNRMFPNSGGLYGTEDELLRSIFGPSFPRKVNKAALHRAERGYHTINIPNG